MNNVPVFNKTKTLTFLIISALSGLSWSADYDTTNLQGKKATTQQYLEALKPQPASKEGLEFRSLGLGGSVKAVKKAVSMELNFELDSFELTTEAKKELNNLGRALQDPQLSQFRFLIEGHTDASGTDDYNKSLSEKRAENVKRYLMTNFSIDASRLRALGRGEFDLLNKDHPESPDNRRVQIVNFGETKDPW